MKSINKVACVVLVLVAIMATTASGAVKSMFKVYPGTAIGDHVESDITEFVSMGNIDMTNVDSIIIQGDHIIVITKDRRALDYHMMTDGKGITVSTDDSVTIIK